MSARKLAIAIVGPTASGKTKLGVAIAKAYLGEVISVDSLQCYKPGGIITARPLPEETEDVPHHLIDYLEADEEPEDYVSQAVRIMEDISARDGLPILVGGSTSLTMPLLQAAFAREYEVLALTLVPQRSAYQRLVETRGDEMLQRGLLEELKELHRLEKRLLHGVSDLSRGVWKAIGYREYLPYLHAIRSVNGTADGCSSSQEEHLREEGRLAMNASTLHYGQDQLEWMRHTLVPFLHRHRAATVSLCVTNKAAWEAEVQGPALTMAGEFCHGASRARHALGFFPKKKRVVCVFGGSSGGHDSSHIDAAKALGVTLHRHDMCLVYGGGTTGIMGAVASTLVALSGPSAVHGVVPAALARYESAGIGDGRVDGEYASRFGRRTVVRDMHTRKRLMTQMVREGAPGSGFVALSGGYGTLEELLEAATWHQLGIHRCGVSVFSVDGFYDGLLDWIRRVAGHGFVGNKDADIIRVARTAEEVVTCLDEGSRGGDHGLEWV
ncbi:hypothetical protein E4U17_004312 [Claviceps sp. LM77 group G4]|nr:hypothetical protein E4U17_004312 [Claviceps sp. LM77 group G4]KAG6078152.1 hypothetical protein E4U33_000874 [Claviceps sp. LM78 group G4]KAG6078812.1 hypothetical protein E4U16_001425 [Claviceps sp. LM84 group G4]